MGNRHEGKMRYCRMDRKTMSRPAWKALSPTAQALYPWFQFEWAEPPKNNHGRTRLLVRQAAQCIGVTLTKAAKAIHDLQRKGWLVVFRKASLGVAGKARKHEYEITEIALPAALERKEDRKDGEQPRLRQLHVFWHPGKNYPVADMR